MKEEKCENICNAGVSLEDVHNLNHMGVEPTLYLVGKLNLDVSRESVKKIIKSCLRCQCIDPASVIHTCGELSVNMNWWRLAVDVTHYRQLPYLSVVDCGPGRFAICRELKREDATEVAGILEDILLVRGPVDKILMDNSTVFQSETLK